MLTSGMQERVAKDITKSLSHIIINGNYRIEEKNFVVKGTNLNKTVIQFDIPDEINKVRHIELYNIDNTLISTINTTFDSAINTRVRYTISVELK